MGQKVPNLGSVDQHSHYKVQQQRCSIQQVLINKIQISHIVNNCVLTFHKQRLTARSTAVRCGPGRSQAVVICKSAEGMLTSQGQKHTKACCENVGLLPINVGLYVPSSKKTISYLRGLPYSNRFSQKLLVVEPSQQTVFGVEISELKICVCVYKYI
jgi:hypothetical protein